MKLSRALLASALADGLGLGVPQAEVLVILLESPGVEFTSKRLCYLCSTHRPLALNVFQERIRRIREVMGRDAIAGFRTCAESQGRSESGKWGLLPTTYSLSHVGYAKCRAALDRVAAALPHAFDTDSTPLRTAASSR